MKPHFFALLALVGWNVIWSQCICDPLPAAQGTIITVNNVMELHAALSQAYTNNGHTTIELNTGTYQLESNLLFISSNMSNLTIRGAIGNRDSVTIKGLGWDNSAVTHIFNVAADSFTLADVTIGEVYFHPIQIHSNPNDADYCRIQNVRFVDAKEQLLKVSAGGLAYADNGKVICCLFEFTAGVAFQYYTGGIDAHRSKNWEVKYNTFKNIRSPGEDLAEHAIHFWRESLGTVVEGNQIINCDRGIGFGLGGDITSGHQDGLIMNNFVHTSRDVGIGLESAPNTKVYNNTVVTENYQNSIEYRFPTTGNVHIANNITTDLINDRNSGSSGLVESNFQIGNLDIFVDPNAYDYHLDGTASGITDNGLALSEVLFDYDCMDRPVGNGPDIGADEGELLTSTDVLLDISGILLFPNPVVDTFTITGLLNAYTIQVLNQLGLVYQTYDQVSGTVEIDISNLPVGLYFIKIEGKTNEIISIQLILKN